MTRVAVQPEGTRSWLEDAVRAGGGEVVPPADAEALVWAATSDAAALRAVLDEHRHLAWVQLPWAGIEPFVEALDHDRTWTCGKGVYAEPVAEHALGLALALLRHLHTYARATTWRRGMGRNLLGARVTVLGGGGITRSLLRLLAPFGASTTVLRRTPEPLDGADRVLADDQLHAVLPETDVLFLALALTPATEGIIGAPELDLLPDHAVVVNVARGAHVDTDALVAALEAGTLGGAGLDVTEPEPLPDDHPLWHVDRALVTPHTANTPEMAVPLLSARVRENVRRRGAGEELLGLVDVDAGY